MRQYDIFISYRRSSFELANLIATRLKAAGYRVFFDLEAMDSGPFNKQLFRVIEECRDFVLVLPPNTLERCKDEDDWVRKEVLHALQNKKNIIPILLNGFQWPKTMPSGMEELSMYQSIAASIDYFDLAMQRLESYLKSRKYTRQRLIVRWATAIVLSVSIILVSLLCLFRSIAKPLCEQVVEHLTLKVAIADFMMSDNKILIDTWKECQTSDKSEVYESLELVEDNLESYESSLKTSMELSSWQKFLISLYQTSPSYLAQIDDYVLSMSSELKSNMSQMRNTISKDQLLPSDINHIEGVLDLYPAMGKALYYTYLQILNKLPESSLTNYHELAPKFENMPDTGLGLRNSEYDVLIKQAFEGTDHVIKGLKDNVAESEDELYLKEKELDSLNNAVYAQYRGFVEKISFNADATPEKNWNGILVLSAFLDLSIEMYQEALATGDDPGLVTPQLVLADINKALDNFQSCHKEVGYVASAKEFFKQTLEGLPFGGVLITQFAPNTTHNVYKVGDIIVEWNGSRVNNLEELKAAYAKSASGKMKILRLEQGKLKEISMSIPGNEDIVAFCNLIDPE